MGNRWQSWPLFSIAVSCSPLLLKLSQIVLEVCYLLEKNLLFLLQTVLGWMSYVSIGCVLGYVICFAVGLGMLRSLYVAQYIDDFSVCLRFRKVAKFLTYEKSFVLCFTVNCYSLNAFHGLMVFFIRFTVFLMSVSLTSNNLLAAFWDVHCLVNENAQRTYKVMLKLLLKTCHIWIQILILWLLFMSVWQVVGYFASHFMLSCCESK